MVNKSIFEAMIGGIILLFVIILIYLVSMRTYEGDEEYKVVAYFDDVTGISIGSHVTISGIKVGEVSNTTFDYKRKAAKLEMQIRKDIKLPDDSSAQVISKGFMGDKLVKIELGASDNLLDAGEEIEYTQSMRDIESLIQKFVFN